MAEHGISKLEACNEMLRAIGLRPVAALDTSGTADVSEAERVLDRNIEYTQAEGWPGNMAKAKSYTADGSGNITFDSAVLRVECVFPGRHAGNVTIRDGKAYSTAEDTNSFGAAAVLGFNVWTEVAWAQLPPDLKHRILAAAKLDYYQSTKQRQDLPNFLSQQAAMADVKAQRIANDTQPPPNIRPIIAAQGPGGGGG